MADEQGDKDMVEVRQEHEASTALLQENGRVLINPNSLAQGEED